MKLSLLLLVASLSFIASAKEPAKIYHAVKADHFGKLIIIPSEQENQYLINYTGFNSEFDDKTLLYKKQKNDFGDRFHYQLSGTSRVNLIDEGYSTLILGTTVPYQTVKLANGITSKVIFAGHATTKTIEKIETQYNQLQGLTHSKVEAKKHIKAAQEALSKNCEQAFKISIQWQEFEHAKQKTTPGMLTSYLKALGHICKIDTDYLEAVQTIKTIKLSLSQETGKQDIVHNKGTLHISLNQDVANVFETSYDNLLAIF